MMKWSFVLMFIATMVAGGSCFQSSAATNFHDFDIFNISSHAPTISLWCQDTKKCHVCLIADDRADCAVTDFPASFLAYLLMEEEVHCEKKVEEELVYEFPEKKVESGFRNASSFAPAEEIDQKVQEDICPAPEVTVSRLREGDNMFFNSTCPAPSSETVGAETCPALFSFKDYMAKEDTCPALFTVDDYKFNGETCSAAEVFYAKEPVCLIEEGPRSEA